jgi:tRNA 2-selenouridine synthase
MAWEKIDTGSFLHYALTCPVIDVRSPAEYKHAHIPGAFSLPLFSDEERAIVGTAYKQESREAAIKHGLDFFGPGMKKMVEEAEEKVRIHGLKNKQKEDATENSKIILIYCWRGGMRSAAVAWLLDLYGFKVFTLAGGYKKFRNYVLETFSFPYQIKILGGYTGSGKTGVLKTLRNSGEAVIDLEDIAKHKGSAFGNIGMPLQPTQEMFENILGMELRNMLKEKTDLSKPKGQDSRVPSDKYRYSYTSFWLEDESQRIGLVNIPNAFWDTMRNSPVYFLDMPFEDRLNNIELEYGNLDRQRMIDAIGRIKERLGGLEAKNAIRFLEEGNTTESFRILLKYYDKWYLKALHNRKNINSLLHSVTCTGHTPLNELINLIQ